ncbi:hypothetical protein JM946_21715 [Steroidobacter sp. S1-65]|uniref:Peptidase MA superfamily protein n=1 Tax=Steroidobacter gossypii TaxID=2805490 RepID=A0ABS1X2B0_9GAMM|nr:hypothetical protein [Steroidobacter gossypii]MBM0107365.1 hypothetical protein [Steroidobacter gossypii]
MKFLANMFGKKAGAPAVRQTEPAPLEILCEGASQPFAFQEHLYSHEELPILDWQAAVDWSARASNPASALIDCKRGWLLHLRDALGQGYDLRESAHAAVLSTGDERYAAAMLDFIERTRRRIAVTLEGVATFRDDDREILIIFDDPDSYYRYVSHAYPEDGEFAFSSGMFLHAGCPHFVTMRDEHHTVERVITHEMTHASVAHLRIPLWLNEGLAVNAEDRLMGKQPKLFDPPDMRRKHLAFWSRDTIQEFWSGHSFGRPDDGCMLSYDLAQILVEILAGHWPQFRAFATAASYQDGGASAASEHMGIDLGESLAAIFEQASADGWRPDPEKWRGDVAHTPE